MKFPLAILILLSLATPGAVFAQYEASALPLTPLVEAQEPLDAAALKSQPLPIRRKIVASQLSAIHLRLAALYEKTNLAATRLGENGIDVTSASSELTLAATSLTTAKLAIDTLIATANDPANASATTILIEGNPFKDVVIKTETDLRTAREHIIGALSLLKIAVTSAVDRAE